MLTSLEQKRVWDKIFVGNDDDCWLWMASTNQQGYGRFCLSRVTEEGKRIFLAHRLVWEMTNGPIPDGLCVLHSCDVTRCCNPRHLWLGTKLDNTRDMLSKNRATKRNRGEGSGKAVLTANQVLAIRARYAEGDISTRDLGDGYGVSHTHILSIVHYRCWVHM